MQSSPGTRPTLAQTPVLEPVRIEEKQNVQGFAGDGVEYDCQRFAIEPSPAFAIGVIAALGCVCAAGL
jgi:hypothetical protein